MSPTKYPSSHVGRSPNHGRGVVRLEGPSPAVAELNPLQLLHRITGPDYHPPVLPSVAVELIAFSRKPSVRMRDIAALLEQDPVLTADTLRIVQSSAFEGNSPIRTIDEALVRLGLRRASELFFRAALEAKLFRCSRAEAVFERLRRHAIAVADLSRLICRKTAFPEDSAYLCGLLHDVGIAGCLLAIGCDKSDQLDSFEAMWPTVSAVHAKVALHLAVLWNLPEELRLVLAHHLAFATTNPVHPLAAITYLAEVFARESGMGFEDENDGAQTAKAAATLQLTQQQLKQLGDWSRDLLTSVVAS
jgi:HD-like signal output (HDOD) protein